MDNSTLITVIVPAYNVAQWLPRCLDSILLQTHGDLEILVIDDGSTDETPAIADRYAEKDNRIRVIHQSNCGLVEVRERGIREARGRFIGFVDGDDEIIPEMYQRLFENALRYGAQISQCGILYCFYDGRKKPVGETGDLVILDREEGLIRLLRGDRMEPSLCNKLYVRELLCNSCPDKTLINNEDLLRNFVLFSRAERSVMEGFCGYLYWRRSDSMSNNSQAVRTAKNILEVRRIILDSTEGNVHRAAEDLFASGLVNTVNSLVGKKDRESAELRQYCRKELRRCALRDAGISAGTRLRAGAICAAPWLYGLLFSAHRKRMYARIRKQAESLRQTDTGDQRTASGV